MSSILQEFVQALKSKKVEIIDMSHTLLPATPVIELPEPFNQTLPFSIEEISNFDERGPNWYWNNIHLGEHTGTHFDAPIHWITGRDYPDGSVDKIPAEKLIAPAIVIDVTAKVDADNEYLMTLDDVKAWEDEHGMIPEGAWVLVRTGWQSRYPTGSVPTLVQRIRLKPAGRATTTCTAPTVTVFRALPTWTSSRRPAPC